MSGGLNVHADHLPARGLPARDVHAGVLRSRRSLQSELLRSGRSVHAAHRSATLAGADSPKSIRLSESSTVGPEMLATWHKLRAAARLSMRSALGL